MGNGGAEGDRTPDLYNAIVALSQLSYGPVPFQSDAPGRSPALPLWLGGRPLEAGSNLGKRGFHFFAQSPARPGKNGAWPRRLRKSATGAHTTPVRQSVIVVVVVRCAGHTQIVIAAEIDVVIR